MLKPLANFLIAFCLLTSASSVHAQSSAFTYQGKLTSNAQPAEGLHDFRFRLYDAATGGSQIGTTQCLDDVPVTGGTFSATIDFGAQFVTAGARFLEIDVRANIGQPCTDVFGYVLLTPRQAITPTPSATHAKSAFGLAAADGSPSNAVVVDNAGNVGIGTAAPTHNLHIATVGPTLALQDTDSSGGAGGQQVGYVSYRDSGNIERAWVGYGSAGDPDFSIINVRNGGDIVLNTFSNGGKVGIGTPSPTNALSVAGSADFSGNVGIGTTLPTSKLHVVGDASVFGDLLVGSIDSTSMFTSRVDVESNSNLAPSIYGRSLNGNLAGVAGESGNAGSSSATGVVGKVFNTNANCFGVLALGRLGATGTKSFRIDHPEYPDTHYLFHYSAESPEALNFYRGTVTLDERGRATIKLPSYFAKINRDPSYQLTPVGAPMPNLHVADEISELALIDGANQPLGVPGPGCSFTIAGGTPGSKVSWRVEAVRNDEFVRKGGAPVEVEKPPQEQGLAGAPLSMAEIKK